MLLTLPSGRSRSGRHYPSLSWVSRVVGVWEGTWMLRRLLILGGGGTELRVVIRGLRGGRRPNLFEQNI